MPGTRNFGEKSFSSFSGADIRATFGGAEIGELQAISYAIQREKAPVYVMGRKDPLAFSRGKRGIAGTLVFITIDSHALLSAMGMLGEELGENIPKFLSDKRAIRPLGGQNGQNVDVDDGAPGLLEDNNGSIDFTAGYELSGAWFADQIPPFDVTLTAANEYGAAMTMRIIGVELLNEGAGMSVDDIVLENQYTYVARTLSPWQPSKQWKMDYRGSRSTVVNDS